MQFRHRRRFADAELDAPVREEIERRYALRHARRVIGRELNDAVAEADVLRALACGGEEYFGGGGVRVLFEEVVFDLPREVVAQTIGEFDLRQAVLEQVVF